jgi:DNA polymerase-3 subunit epsilon
VNRLLFLDCEGTGTDPHTDRIVEICLHRPGGLDLTVRVNPGVPIPAEASEVHGIYDADVASCPRFAEIAPQVQQLVGDAVLVGYNLRRYDTLLIDAELKRAGQPGLPRCEQGRISVPELDLYQLWLRHEARSLVGAAKRFAGVDLEDAHSAEADTVVLPAVLEGMVRAFGLQDLTPDDRCALCVPEGEVDRDGKFRRRDDGVVIFNFSQSRGRPVSENPGLLEWMLSRDFSAESKAVARQLLDEIYGIAETEEDEEGVYELPF